MTVTSCWKLVADIGFYVTSGSFPYDNVMGHIKYTFIGSLGSRLESSGIDKRIVVENVGNNLHHYKIIKS